MSALPRRSRRPTSHLGRASLLAVLAVIAIGCSSNNNSPSPTVATSPEAVSPSTGSSPPAASPSAATVDLSGTWSGQYDGAFNGTFTLTWTQSNSKLTGSIKLSTDGTVNLNGVVTGNSIRFGTVGSTAITYSGTVSGDSMSGTYQVGGATGGNWSATKTS